MFTCGPGELFFLIRRYVRRNNNSKTEKKITVYLTCPKHVASFERKSFNYEKLNLDFLLFVSFMRLVTGHNHKNIVCTF